MSVIYKYDIKSGVTTLELPASPEFLRVAIQNGELYLWAVVDPLLPSSQWAIEVVGTGQHTHLDQRTLRERYIGSVDDGPFVWHVFAHKPGEGQ